jgi:hypothetical protein
MQNMRKRMLFTLMVSLFAAFCLVGTSMAANTVTIKSDKPIIPKSDCGHAGNITLQFDKGTQMHEGDVIRFKLDDGSTVCGNINYFLNIADAGHSLGSAVGTPIPKSADPIQISDGGAGYIDTLISGAPIAQGSDIKTNGSTVQVGFLVQGTDSTPYVTLTLALRQISTGKVYTDATNSLTVKFMPTNSQATLDVHLFDGNLGGSGANEKLYVVSDSTKPTIYDKTTDTSPALSDVAVNTLCINTSKFTSSLDHAIPESRPYNNDSTYQQSFLGDYIIAQLVAAVQYKVTTACKDDICNPVAIGSQVDQQGITVTPSGLFDFGDYSPAAKSSTLQTDDRWTSTGYCSNYNSLGNGLLFYKDGDTFASGDQFKVTMTVRVGSSADDTKAIWNSPTVNDYWTSNSAGGNCSLNADPITTTATASTAWAYGTTKSSTTDKTVLDGTYTITSSTDSYNALMLDLPVVSLPDLTKVSAGEKVYVDVVVSKLPCGGPVVTQTFCLSELVDTCPTTTTTSIDGIVFIGDRQLTRVLHGYLGRLMGATTYTTTTSSGLFFPYAPALNDSDFFTGLVVDNTGTADVVLTVTLKDSAGGSATYTSGTIKAGNQFADVLDNMKDSLVEGTTPLDLTKNVMVSVSAAAVK